MPHIHLEPGHHDHTVSFFIVRTDFEEPKLMYHVHRKTGRLSMFGGHVELDETPWQTLLHELEEESGYGPEQVELLQPDLRLPKCTGVVTHPLPLFVHTGLFPVEPEHYHTDMMYALVTDEEPQAAPLEGESQDIRLFSLSELREVSEDEIYEAWREIGIYILTEVMQAWDQVPLSEFEC